MSAQTSSTAHDASAATLPAPGVRTLLSLALVWHLFAVAVAIGTNFGAESSLRASLRRVARDYLQLLDMDIAFDVQWANGSEVDQDHTLIAEIPAADNGQPTTALFPPDDLWPGQRRRRYQIYAFHQAEQVQLENDTLVSDIPRAVGARLLADHQASKLRLRLRAHDPQTALDASAVDRARRDPNAARYYRDVYQADVFPSGDEVLVMKIEQRRDVAPVAQPQSIAQPPQPLRQPLP